MDSRLKFPRTRSNMSENEKGLSYSLGVNQFTDLTKEEFESTFLGYKPQNVSKLVTTLGRFHYDGGIKDLSCEEPGPVRFGLGFQYD